MKTPYIHTIDEQIELKNEIVEMFIEYRLEKNLDFKYYVFKSYADTNDDIEIASMIDAAHLLPEFYSYVVEQYLKIDCYERLLELYDAICMI